MDEAYHYPPELFQLLVDTIPLLCRAKNDVVLFFRGAGVSAALYSDIVAQLNSDRSSLNKYQITRTILTRINEPGDKTLRERREVLRRVVQFEEFSTCWPTDQLKARGLVAQIRSVVNVKDSFTRMQQERQKEADDRRTQKEAAQRELEARRRTLDEVRSEIGALLGMTDASARGTKFEKVLSKLFVAYGILVREPFRLVSDKTARVLEQIDGVIELDSALYLVEVKWVKDRVDVEDVSRHLVRIYHRGSARGLFVSVTEFTEASLETCKEALQKTVVSLCLLEEILEVLEHYGDLPAFLRKKFHAAQIEKRPFVRLRAKQ